MTLIIDSTTYRTTNYDRDRNGDPLVITPQGILLHNGGGTIGSDMYELTGKSPRRVSANYYVTRAGVIYQLGPDNRRYWHAGAPDRQTTRWHGNSPAAFGVYDGNLLIGIESQHRAGADWPAVQIGAITALCQLKVDTYHFPLTRIGAHRWYAPSRKADPQDLPDAEIYKLIQSLYEPSGFDVRVTTPAGARIRQGPGTQFPIVTTLPEEYVFWSDGDVVGQAIDGVHSWYHFAGPTRSIPDPLGFVFAGICEKVS